MREVPSAIRDYAIIGDLETAALVARNGSIDWLCLPRFDSPACFAALLGTPDNGRWLIAPKADAKIKRRYRPDSLILETEFRTAKGAVTLIDFMPVRTRNPKIVRIVRGKSGSVRMQMDLAIRFDYGLTVPWVTTSRNGLHIAVAGPNRVVLRCSVPVRGEDLRTVSDFTVKAGEEAHFEMRYARSFRRFSPDSDLKASLRETERLWRKWAKRCKYKGPFSADVRRSLITLKALTYHPTGGIVAAPTTSLPEVPKGGHNWDYRYCWLRDATFTLLGFIHAGYRREALRWKDWLVRTVAGSADQVQVLYGPAGERLLREWEVPWLSGYQGALPVRVGNLASEQLQLDLYGELADVLHQAHLATKHDGSNFDLQLLLMQHLARIWREPDHGIWELRGRPHQFTHSKVMTWVAFDRCVRSAELFGGRAPVDEWRGIREEIHEDVCRNGFDSRLRSFVQFYGSKEVDASLLLIPLVGFLPANDQRVVGTVRRIEETLLNGGFVMRFRDMKTRGQKPEGAFLPCSFWLADYYQLAGRPASAKRLLKRLLDLCNDVGLLSEEYDVASKQFCGNFPQALTHVALVNTVINLHSKHGPMHQRSGANHGPLPK
jgi:GH15 family glucan-1,4-alpha-glucosidase